MRLFSQTHAKFGVEAIEETGQRRGKLVDINVERKYSALKNITDYHVNQGTLPVLREGTILRKAEDGFHEVDREADCRLYWCEIDSDMPVEFWQSRREVEAVITKEELEQFMVQIRGRTGANYIEACEAFARTISVHSADAIRYIPPRPRAQEAPLQESRSNSSIHA